MNIILKASALAAATATLATALPATAAVSFSARDAAYTAPGNETFNQRRDWSRDRRYARDDYRRGYGNDYRQPVRSWRGNDGRYYCQRPNGTTGLLIGGAAGALLGREIDALVRRRERDAREALAEGSRDAIDVRHLDVRGAVHA